MAKLFNDKPDWTFGIELELNCKVKAKSSFPFLTITDENEKKVLEVSGDMGAGDERTVEIATSPVKISEETQHRDHMQLIGFLKGLFDHIAQVDGHTMTRDQMENEFREFMNGTNHTLSSRYTFNGLLKELTITSVNPVATMTEQISFGVPVTDVDYFLQSMNASWYQTGKFVLKDATAEQQWKYNYTLCLMEHLISLLSSGMDITSPMAKNSWVAMPRNPVSELWDKGLQQGVPLKNVLDLFQNTYELNKINEAYEYLSNGGPAGGKLSSIVRLEKQIVFECRKIFSCLREFYFG